jgi:hypothetical protein
MACSPSGRQPLRSTPRRHSRCQRSPGRRPPAGAAAHAGTAHARCPSAGQRQSARHGARLQLPVEEASAQKANAEYLMLDTRLLIEDVAQDSQIAKRAWAQAAVEGGGRIHRASDGRAAAPGAHAGQAFTRGPQSALVVGPAGQNIWTDELGRIKVQFPWDRIGRRTSTAPAGSGCRVRGQATSWAASRSRASARRSSSTLSAATRTCRSARGAPTTRRTCRRGHCRASRRCRASGAAS